jgi:hypothetical protein
VQVLDIENNHAGAAGVAALGEALRAGNCPQLRTLNIRGNYSASVFRASPAPKADRTLGIGYNAAGTGASKADLGDLSTACPQLKVKD